MNGKPTTTFTSETARAAGKASAEARRRKRELSAEERALEAIGARLGPLTKELLDAAMGEGAFEGLKPETRLTAILRALEWKLGKAPTAKPRVEDEKPEVPSSDSLFA